MKKTIFFFSFFIFLNLSALVLADTSYNCVSQGFLQYLLGNTNISMTGNLDISGWVKGSQLCVPDATHCISAWSEINASESSKDYVDNAINKNATDFKNKIDNLNKSLQTYFNDSINNLNSSIILNYPTKQNLLDNVSTANTSVVNWVIAQGYGTGGGSSGGWINSSIETNTSLKAYINKSLIVVENITAGEGIFTGTGQYDTKLGYSNAKISGGDASVFSGRISFEYKLGAANTIWQIDNGGDSLRFFDYNTVYGVVNKSGFTSDYDFCIKGGNCLSAISSGLNGTNGINGTVNYTVVNQSIINIAFNGTLATVTYVNNANASLISNDTTLAGEIIEINTTLKNLVTSNDSRLNSQITDINTTLRNLIITNDTNLVTSMNNLNSTTITAMNNLNTSIGWKRGSSTVILTTSTDNVGIGTNIPSYTLQMQGTYPTLTLNTTVAHPIIEMRGGLDDFSGEIRFAQNLSQKFWIYESNDSLSFYAYQTSKKIMNMNETNGNVYLYYGLCDATGKCYNITDLNTTSAGVSTAYVNNVNASSIANDTKLASEIIEINSTLKNLIASNDTLLAIQIIDVNATSRINWNDFYNMSKQLLGYKNLTVCSENQVLKIVAGVWTCSAMASGSGSYNPDNFTLVSLGGIDQINQTWLNNSIVNIASRYNESSWVTAQGFAHDVDVNNNYTALLSLFSLNDTFLYNSILSLGNYSNSTSTIKGWISANSTADKLYCDGNILNNATALTTDYNNDINNNNTALAAAINNNDTFSHANYQLKADMLGNLTTANTSMKSYVDVTFLKNNTGYDIKASKLNLSNILYTSGVSINSNINALYNNNAGNITAHDANFTGSLNVTENATINGFHITKYNTTYYVLWGD